MIRPRTHNCINTGTRGHRQQSRGREREGVGITSGFEEPAFLCLQREPGAKDTVITSRLKNSAGPTSIAALIRYRRGLHPVAHAPAAWCASDHDDIGIHHRTDGDGDPAEAHDVGAIPMAPMMIKAVRTPYRQHDDCDQSAARVHEEDQADKRNDGDAFPRTAWLQGVDSAIDEVRAVVDRERSSTRLADCSRSLRSSVLTFLITVSAFSPSREARCRSPPPQDHSVP